jgi:hypothetical protein
MIQSSRLSSILLSALFPFLFVAGTLLPGSLRAAEEKKIEFPAASQHSVVKQRVGLTDVEVDYSRPNKNDREIFGGLVPYGKLWRTGANAVTKIKFSDAVTLGGKEIPAGEYALFTIPTANEWTIILSKDAKIQSAADYKQENDVARITAMPESLPVTIETFTIALNDVKGASATLDFLWDKTRVPVKLTTDDVEQVSKRRDCARRAHRLSSRSLLLRQQQGYEPGGEVDRPGAGEEPRRLLYALQEGADSGEAWEQERSHRLGAKGDRHPEERQSAGRVRHQQRAADH